MGKPYIEREREAELDALTAVQKGCDALIHGGGIGERHSNDVR